MNYIINIIAFSLIYHICFFIIKDIIQYHKIQKIQLSPKIINRILFVIIVFIIVPIIPSLIVSLFNYGIITQLILSFGFGIIFTQNNWLIFMQHMKKYRNTYFYTFSKFDASNISKSLFDTPENLKPSKEQKILDILTFMEPYPYQILVNSSNTINACSYLDENKIIITKGVLKLPIEEIMAVLGHEIKHFKVDRIKYNKDKKIKLDLSLYLIYFIIIVASAYFSVVSKYFLLVTLIIFIIYVPFFIFFHIVMTERYLYQMSELKCDRLACQLPGVTKEGMIKLLTRLEKTQKNYIKKYPWYLEIIRRYFLFEDHPNIKYRIKRIKKYCNWNILEFIKVPLHMCFRLITGKGWN